MSRLAARSLLEAVVRRSIREDRITEVLASLLRQDPEVRHTLCRLVGAPALSGAAVLTQRVVPGVGCVDCELRLTQGSELHIIWIEVKVGAKEQPTQLWRYARALRRLYRDEGTLVALAPDGDPIFESAAARFLIDGREVSSRTAAPLTWSQLGTALDLLGSSRDGRRWRELTRRPDALAERRVLCDVLDYLEREDVMEPEEPITSADAHVIYRAYSLLDDKHGAVKRLLELATPRVSLIAGRAAKDWSGVNWRVREVLWDADGWPRTINRDGITQAQIGLLGTDELNRPDEPRGDATFYVGLSFKQASPLTIKDLTHPAWTLPEDIWVAQRAGREVNVRKGLYVSELAVRGVTLSQQAEALAEWANKAFDAIVALPDPRAVRSASSNTDTEVGPDGIVC